MRADRTIGICNRDRTFKDLLKCLPDIKPLGLAADQHRYRLEFARDLTGRLGCRGPFGLRRGSGFARRRDGIELQLQIRFGGVPLRLQLGEPGGRLHLGALSLLLCLRRDGRAKCRLGGRQLRFGFELQIFRRAHRRRGPRGLTRGGNRGESHLDRILRRLLRLCGTGGGEGGGTGLRLE